MYKIKWIPENKQDNLVDLRKLRAGIDVFIRPTWRCGCKEKQLYIGKTCDGSVISLDILTRELTTYQCPQEILIVGEVVEITIKLKEIQNG